MNNLLPSRIKIHQKYDLKGSTYKRKVKKNTSFIFFHYMYEKSQILKYN